MALLQHTGQVFSMDGNGTLHSLQRRASSRGKRELRPFSFLSRKFTVSLYLVLFFISPVKADLSFASPSFTQKTCRELARKKADCKVEQDELADLEGMTTTLMRGDLTGIIKKKLLTRAQQTMQQQVEMLNWLGRKINPQLIRNVEREMEGSCGKDGSSLKRNYMSQIKKLGQSLRSTNERPPFDEQALSQWESSVRKEALVRRYIFATLEFNRIGYVVRSYPLSKPEKKKLRQRQDYIRAYYPLVTKTRAAGLLIKKMASTWKIQQPFGRKGDPLTDEFLFPDAQKGFRNLQSATNSRKAHHLEEQVLQKLLNGPVPAEIKQAFVKSMELSLVRGLRSVAQVCRFDDCETIGLSDQTLQQAHAERMSQWNVYYEQAICACQKEGQESPFSDKHLASGAMIGLGSLPLCLTAVLCPVSLLINASVSMAGAINTFDDLAKVNRSMQQKEVAGNIPGGSRQEARRHYEQAKKELGDIAKTGGWNATGVVGTTAAVVFTKRLLKNAVIRFRLRKLDEALDNVNVSDDANIHTLKGRWWKKKVISVERKKKFVDLVFGKNKFKGTVVTIENSVLKRLNDKDIKDQALATLITKKYHQAVLEAIRKNGFLKKYFHDEAVFRDYKNLDLAFSTENNRAVQRQMKQVLQKADQALESFIGSRPHLAKELADKKSYLADHPTLWFKAGIGNNPDAANLAARMARKEKSRIAFASPTKVKYQLSAKLPQVESLRKQITQRVVKLAGNTHKAEQIVVRSPGNEKLLLSEKAVAILRKAPPDRADAQEYIIDRFRKRGVNLSEDPELVGLLRRYYSEVDELSPRIFEATSDALEVKGGAATIIDIGGAGSTNNHIWMDTLAQAADNSTDKGLAFARQGADQMMKTMEGRRNEIYNAVRKGHRNSKTLPAKITPGGSQPFSGDDGIIRGEVNISRVLKTLQRSKEEPSRYRLVFTPDAYHNTTAPLANDVREKVAHVGQEIEKTVREVLMEKNVLISKELDQLGISFKAEIHPKGEIGLTPYFWGRDAARKSKFVEKELEGIARQIKGRVFIRPSKVIP